MHLADGVLRRMVDEAPLVGAEARHYAQCARCQARYAEIAATAEAAATALAGPAPMVDAERALTRMRRTLATEPARPRTLYERMMAMTSHGLGARVVKPLSAVVAVGVMALLLALTPLGSYAQSVLTLFTPKQFVAVPVSSDQMRTLMGLTEYGTFREPKRQTPQRVGSAAEAAAAAGLTLKLPTTLPASVPTTAEFHLMPGTQTSFTFSAAKAQAAAAARGKPLPQMPANIDGSTVTMDVPTAVVLSYGASTQKAVEALKAAEAGRSFKGDPQAQAQAARELAAAPDAPKLMVMQMRAPVVTSTGVTVPELQSYLLSQPGIAPDLAAAIKSITDPTTTMPIPVPVGQVSSRPVKVQGVDGLALGDATGLGAAVIWQQDGVVYTVAGPLKESEVLAVANSLK